MRQVKQVMADMIIGMVIWGLAALAVLEIIFHGSLAIAAGVAVGVLTAAGLLWHMYHHLDIALDMDSGHAQRHVQFAAMKRLAIMAVVLAVSMTQYRYINPIGTVVGIFGLKLAAFFQPMVHRLRSQIKH